MTQNPPTTAPRFRATFLLPKYWGNWLLMGLLWGLMFVPRRWVMRLARPLGDQLAKRSPKRRHIVAVNLRLCFAHLSEAERAQQLNAHFRSYACSLLDMGLALWGSRRRLARLMEVQGLERVRELLAQQRVLLVTYHLTTLEILGTQITQLHPCVSMMNHDNNPLLTWQQYRARRRFCDMVLVMREQGLARLVRGLRRGRMGLYIPDEDFGHSQHRVFARFFGVPRASLDTVGRIARLSDACVIPCACLLDERSGRYRMIFAAPLKSPSSMSVQQYAEQVNRAMEALIRLAPQQYMWTFRWFRTRPRGQPNPYAV